MDSFENDHFDCPWFDTDECTGQVTYNQHVNDPRYAACEEHTCPIVYWIKKLKANLEINS